MSPQTYFFDLTPAALQQRVEAIGLPRFRGKQLLEWVYRHGVADPQAMTNLSKRDRDVVAEHFTFTLGSQVRHATATDGTQKLLLQWQAMPAEGDAAPTPVLPLLDDPSRQTECVMIPTDNRRTACISSQVGCAVGCRFCASGLGGLDGNLSHGQIVEQAWRLHHLKTQRSSSRPLTNIVFMGMGEPLSNFENVVRAVRTLMAVWGLHIGGRKITISTVGLPAQMRRLADLQLPATLAISLHAANDELRRQLIPWAQFVTIEQLLNAGRYYFENTGREVTLEYILLHEVNDRCEHARQLADIAGTLRANVNLIRYNEVSDLPFRRPLGEHVRRFQDVLRKRGVNTHIRASRGRDIAAACGQLRHEQQAGA